MHDFFCKAINCQDGQQDGTTSGYGNGTLRRELLFPGKFGQIAFHIRRPSRLQLGKLRYRDIERLHQRAVCSIRGAARCLQALKSLCLRDFSVYPRV